MNCKDCCYDLPKDGHSYCTYEDGECVKISVLEKENADLKNKLEHRNCLDCSNHSSKLRMRTLELEKENAELKERLFKVDNAYKKKFEAEWRLNDLYQRMREDYANAEKCSRKYFTLYRTLIDRCIKAEEIIKKFSEFVNNDVEYNPEHPQEHTDLWNKLCEEAEQFLKDSEVEK